MARKRESVVYLEPIEHKYHHKVTGEIFKSVTTVLGMLEPEFDSEQIALAISMQDPSKKKEQYLKEIFNKCGVDSVTINTSGSYIQPLMGLFKRRESSRH